MKRRIVFGSIELFGHFGSGINRWRLTVSKFFAHHAPLCHIFSSDRRQQGAGRTCFFSQDCSEVNVRHYANLCTEEIGKYKYPTGMLSTAVTNNGGCRFVVWDRFRCSLSTFAFLSLFLLFSLSLSPSVSLSLPLCKSLSLGLFSPYLSSSLSAVTPLFYVVSTSFLMTQVSVFSIKRRFPKKGVLLFLIHQTLKFVSILLWH